MLVSIRTRDHERVSEYVTRYFVLEFKQRHQIRARNVVSFRFDAYS